MKLLLYCTKAIKQKYLLWSNDLKRFFLDGAYNRLIDNLPNYLLNGKIVAECDFEVEEIQAIYINKNVYDLYHSFYRIQDDKEWLDKTCLNMAQLDTYLQGKNGYAIHIKNLHIFDKPRELNEYYTKKKNNVEENEDLFMDSILYTPIKSAPQNMMYAKQPLKEDKIIISIKPEWLCKILNGEKKIEVRKKVLKEMLE